MNKPHSTQPSAKTEITVPRDTDLDTSESSRRSRMPSTDEVNARDEDFATSDQPLRPGSRGERARRRPPDTRRQLDVGTGGDSGRAGREGITGKPIPPRGRM